MSKVRCKWGEQLCGIKMLHELCGTDGKGVAVAAVAAAVAVVDMIRRQ